MTSAGSKCRACKAPAVIDLPRHNANFCAEHLQQFCRRQVDKAIDDFDMLSPQDRVLVAVSGGKDSLAVWDLLVERGHRADGLYIGLGIGTYSDASTDTIPSGTWASTDTSVAVVSPSGIVRAAGKGAAVIVAVVEGMETSAHIQAVFINTPPALSEIPGTTAMEGRPFALHLQATDPDSIYGDHLFHDGTALI